MLSNPCVGMHSIHSQAESKEVATVNSKFNDLIAKQINFIIDACNSKLESCSNNLAVNNWCISCLYLYTQLMKNPIYCDSEQLKQAKNEVRQMHEGNKNFSPKTVVTLNKKRKKLDDKKKCKPRKRIKEDPGKKEARLKKSMRRWFKEKISLTGVYYHINKVQALKGTKKYTCFFDECTECYDKKMDLIRHWVKHGFHYCGCKYIFYSELFKAHRESCSANNTPKSIKVRIDCGCKKPFANGESNTRHHLKNFHCSEKGKYVCLMDGCIRTCADSSALLHHWHEVHKIIRCACKCFFPSKDFKKHKKNCVYGGKKIKFYKKTGGFKK